jgi:RimJ/RimL family protein N-acetyltransferase
MSNWGELHKRERQVIYELDEVDYKKVRPLFRALEYHLTSAAVLDGNCPGRVFVDAPANPRTAFMFSPEGCYLAGNPDNDAFNRALNGAIYAGEAFDAAYALCFVYHPESWQQRLQAILDPRLPIEMPRRHYVCRELKYDWRANVPDGFTVHRIDEALLDHPGLRIPDHVKGWMENNWGSTADFFQRGFGFITVYDHEFVSWSLTDCVSGYACEIGIRTLPSYRRRGLAAITAAAAVDHALANGLSMVGWQCPEDNLGSIGTAEKVGFQKERDYTMYYVFLDEVAHLAEMGHVAFKAGQYRETANLYERVFAMQDDSPNYFYYLAGRAWAALGNRDRAFERLNAAVDRGWTDIVHTEDCREFEVLHGTPEWAAVLERMQQSRRSDHV